MPRIWRESSAWRDGQVSCLYCDGYELGCRSWEVADTLVGRVGSVRTAGSRLVFLDLHSLGLDSPNKDGNSPDLRFQRSRKAQIVCQFGKMQEEDDSLSLENFKAFSKIARRGDSYSVEGYAHVTERGEFSILAKGVPTLLSPSLHQIPDVLEDPEVRARARHVDMLVNPDMALALESRHHVEAVLHNFFAERNFIKVTTPILSASAGGAAARPFTTKATELADEELNLRIAPELWLKRLAVGGMERVYEIGPAFRNEGVDLTHNPEFTICEFYRAWFTLEDLMSETQKLFGDLARRFSDWQAHESRIPAPKPSLNGSFARIEFIPGLEEALGEKLPDLQSADAHERVLALFGEKNIAPPSNATLARLLDALSAHYLEPLSKDAPTFIIHHPACMSPLSKQFFCPRTSQTVAARAELFIDGREYANMYEEENSPFEQRRKFLDQVKDREGGDQEAMALDENYLKTLEWGLPPTGGWGCGIDRIVMLMAGRERMGDVLSFGSLRNVAGLHATGSRRQQLESIRAI